MKNVLKPTTNHPKLCNVTNHLESEAWDWVYFHSYLVCHIASLTAWFDPIWLVCQHPWFGSLSFLKAVVQPTLENRRLTYLDSATRMYPSGFLNNFFVFFEFPRDLQDFEILFFSRKKLSSSDPHPDPFFWHSSDIPSGNIWKSFFLAHALTFSLAFYLASILACLLAYLLTCFLAFYLVNLRRFFVVEVRRGTLRSGARNWGPAGNTLIRNLRWRSGGDTLIRSLRWRSGGEHCDLELGVKVRRGPLRSRACSWGPAEEEQEAGQLT